MLDGTLDTPEERARAARVIDSESARLLHLVGAAGPVTDRVGPTGHGHRRCARIRTAGARPRRLRWTRLGHASRAEIDASSDDIVSADFDRVEQVLGNLIDNAFRHTPPGRRVRAGALRRDGFVEFYVQDEGDGIPAADVPHVFERFYRSAAEPSGSGTGLGLAIAREIVRAHGGEMRVAGAGGGTTFPLQCRSRVRCAMACAAGRSQRTRPSKVGSEARA